MADDVEQITANTSIHVSSAIIRSLHRTALACSKAQRIAVEAETLVCQLRETIVTWTGCLCISCLRPVTAHLIIATGPGLHNLLISPCLAQISAGGSLAAKQGRFLEVTAFCRHQESLPLQMNFLRIVRGPSFLVAD